jgi:hypothetical protein
MIEKMTEISLTVMLRQQKWTVEFTYSALDNAGKALRASCVCWIEAPDIPSAYLVVEESLKHMKDVKVGTIIPGWHSMPPGYAKNKSTDGVARK